jgi:hypothetical protein
MEQTSARYRDLCDRLNGVRRKRHLYALAAGVLSWLLASFLLLTGIILLEQVFAFGTAGRTALFALGLAGTAAAFLGFALKPLLVLSGIAGRESDSAMARLVGAHFPSIRDRLLDAMQLFEGREQAGHHYAVALIDASLEDLYRAVEPLDFTLAVDDRSVRAVRRYAAVAAGLVLFLFVLSPGGFLGSLDRLLHYGKVYAAAQPVRFVVAPGNTEVVRGQNVSVEVLTEGAPVEELTLRARREGELEFESSPLKFLGDRRFAAEMTALKVNTEYYVSASNAESDRYKISVLDRPLIRSLAVRVVPPAYTRLPESALQENTGDVTAYPGSSVRVSIVPSKPVKSAALLFGDSTRIACRLEGGKASASFTVRRNGTYRIVLADNDGLTNADPIEYSVKALADAPPTVELVSPGKNVDLAGNMTLALLARAKDDFGFTRVRLGYRLAQSRYEQPAEADAFIELPLGEHAQTSLDVPYLWDLTTLHLVPEDAVAYFIEVFDNDNVNGPKSARTETFLVRLPSLEEVFSDVAQTHDQSMESMQSVAKETQQMKKDIEDLQRDMKKPREKMDWQQQKKAEELAQRYDEMKKKLAETSSKMDEMMKKMEENSVLSEKTLEKYKELQKLMEQLNSPELQEALKKLQESMKQLTPEQMKQAMDQVKSAEEQFRSSLERTIELLKRIHIEQKIDELVKRAESLKEQQAALRDEASKSDASKKDQRDALAQKQEDLAKQAADLEKEAADLKKKMEEFSKEMPVDKMAKAQEQLAKNEVPKKMSKSGQQMQSGQMGKAGESQEQAEKDLEEFQQEMQQVQKELQDQQMKQIVNEMRRQLQNAVELSKRQEALKDETGGLDPNSQRFRENAQRQNEVMNDLSNVAQALSELAKKTFAVGPEMGKEIGNALKQMGAAMEQMEGRNPGGASNQQLQAMGSLNRAAMMMQGAISGMMQGGGAGMGMSGMMSQLGKMAGEQGSINNGTQQAMGSGGTGQGGQNGQMSAQQQAEYQRLGGQQASVQKSMEQLAQEAKNSGEFSKLLGDLDQVAKEMQEVQSDLVQGNVNPETVKKQERILSRLLESTRSMRERDYEKKRTASAGVNVPRSSPSDLDLSTQEGKNRLRDELRKVLEGAYSKDYEELIRKYYEELEKEKVDDLR